jgi:hypothetical protein
MLLATSHLDFHADLAKRGPVSGLIHSLLPRFWLWALALCLFAGGGSAVVVAQIEAGDRGIAPINSSNDLMVSGIRVDVQADSADEARLKGWEEAQRLGWRALFRQINGSEGAPPLSDSALNGIVSAIIVEREQIGPRRYIATLGIQFDRARAGQILGISGRIFRSPPFLVMPVTFEAGVAQTFETRSDWQRAWAEFRTADSSIDYVRTAGTNADVLLLTPGQTGRRDRSWWRAILDQYGASDVLIPVVRLERQFPGGPVIGLFAARYGPDNELIGTFQLTAPNPAGIRAMLNQGVRRIDALYIQALASGILRTDPSLIIEEPVAPEEIERPAELAAPSATNEDLGGEPAAASDPETPDAPLDVQTPANSFSIQIETPDANAVTGAESALRSVSGVESASANSVAIGGVSVVRVRFRGDSAALRAALAAAGYRVSGSGDTLRISR